MSNKLEDGIAERLRHILDKAPYKYHAEGVTLYLTFNEIEEGRALLKLKRIEDAANQTKTK